jgi:hypothetical protein
MDCLSIHWCTDKHLGGFHFLAIIEASMNAHIFLLGKYCGVEFLDLVERFLTL